MNFFTRREAALSALTVAAALLLLLFLPVTAVAGDDWYPERRRDQFPTNPGHVAVPLPFNLEGIGWGVGVLGALTNVAGTTADVSGAAFTGDITGGYLAVDQLHLAPRRLVLDLGLGYLSKASVVTYNQRGMSSDQDDYSIVEFGDMLQGGLRLTATFLDRRLEGFVGVYGGKGQLASIRDPDGKVIIEAQDAPTETSSTWLAGARFDFTDDAMDPRRGLRCEGSIWHTPPADAGPDSYLTDFSVTGYLPLGRRSTWAFTYFHSDAHVLHEGETDPAAIADSEGDLWASTRSSYGAGLRMVTASGIVYRVDLAFGDEGFAPTVFFMYPWEI